MKYKLTRRRFIRNTMVAGTGAWLGAPHILKSAEVPASERITLGFVGMGKMGRAHAVHNFCKRPGVQGVAVCDVDTTRRKNAADAVNEVNARKSDSASSSGVAHYNDHHDLLAREDIDAIVISTPDHWHAAVTIDALKAGKDVYCEKPLTHNVNEALSVIDEVDQQGRILQTGSQQRSAMLEFRVACELVRNGVIGEVVHADCYFGGPPRACDLPKEPMEPGLDWDRWLGPAPFRPYNSVLAPRGVHDHFPDWRHFWEYGGGGVTDFGAHHLDIARWGLGLDDTLPMEVRTPEGGNGRTGAELVFANGMTIKHAGGGGHIIFEGTDGTIKVGRRIFELTRKDGTKEYEDRLESQMAEEKYLSGPDTRQLYRTNDHAGDFLTAVRTRKKPIAHEGIGGRTVICCHLLNIVYRYGQPLKWDLENNTFAAGGGDPAWLGREYREGYPLPA